MCFGELSTVSLELEIVKLRKLEQADRQEQEALLELYLAAIGMGPGPEGIEPPVQ